MKIKISIIKFVIAAMAIFCLTQSNVLFAQNKSNENIPPMPQLLSLREQANVREMWHDRRGSL